MPADVVVKRLAGLHVDGTTSEGDVDQLIRAENLTFTPDGVAIARSGFHFFANADVGDQTLYYMGRDPLFEWNLLGSPNGYYYWKGGKPAPSLPRTGVINVLSGSRTGNLVTLTIDTPFGHPLKATDSIIVDVADNTYDGQFDVVSVLTAPDRITYTQVLANDVSSGVGTVTVLPTSLYERGVEYNQFLYMCDGRNFQGGGGGLLQKTTGQPVIAAGSMAVHAERIWLFDRSNDGCRLYFSDPGNPNSWPAANFIDIQPGDGTFPMDLVSFQNKLYIFKEREMWVLETPGVPATWVLRRFAYIGADSRSSVKYGGSIYWTAPTGAYRFDGSGIEKLSDPVESIFRNKGDVAPVSFQTGLTVLDSAVFRDQWVMTVGYGGQERFLCFNTKLNLWSEWKFGFYSFDPATVQGIYPTSIWASEYTDVPGDGGTNIPPGIRMTVINTNSQAMLLSTELGASDAWVDQVGTRIVGPTITDKPYSVVMQTKYSEFGDAYNNKRIVNWMLEREGGDVFFDQVDDEARSLSVPLLGSSTLNSVVQNKIRGIGYFRRLSVKLTVTNIKTVGFKFHGLLARMKVRGQKTSDSDEVMS